MPPQKIGRPFTYAWAEWFEQDEFLLTRGKHFSTRAYVMASTVRTEARRRGIKVSVRTTHDEQSVQVIVSRE